MTPLTLLILPREIRDMIYEYLYHEIRYNWPWSRDNHMEEISFDVVDMNLKNVPLFNVLFVNKQVHDEYKENLKSRHFSATIATKPFPKQFALRRRVHDKARAETALSHLHEANLLILNHFPEHEFWSIAARLTKYFVSKAPKLQTIQIGTKLSCPNVAIHRDVHRADFWPRYEAATHPMFRLESPPALLADGFALTRYGEGYHTGYAKTSRLSKLTPRICESEMDVVEYFVARMGVYAYARAGVSVKLIDKNVLVEQWPTSGFLWNCWTVHEVEGQS
jgi:hypothetical protein